MDFHRLVEKMTELNKPLSEDAIDECGMDTTPHSAPNLSVNLSANGLDDITSLMQLLVKINPDASSPKMIADPIDADGKEDGELDNDDDEGAVGRAIGGKLGSMAGGAVGTTAAGPVGGMVGATAGGAVGGHLGDKVGDVIYNKFGGNAVGNAVNKFNTALQNRKQPGNTTPNKIGSIANKAADIAADYITNDALPESQRLQSQIRADLQQRLNSYKSQ
jgi:hypothetical protein